MSIAIHLDLLFAATIDPGHVAVLLAIGLAAGVLGGLLGIGGGLVMIPSLVLVFGNARYGVHSFHLFKMAALATAVVLSIPAVARHAQARAIVAPMLRGIIPMGLAGALAGVALAGIFTGEQTEILRRTFGVFMLASVAMNIWRKRRGEAGASGVDRCPTPTRWFKIGTIVGFPAGVIAGMLGVGGGVWAVPSQNYALGVRLPNAIANSACMIIALAAGAAVMLGFWIVRLDDPQATVMNGLWLAALLAPGAAVGGWFGAKLTHTLPVDRIRNVFYLLLIVTGLRLAFF